MTDLFPVSASLKPPALDVPVDREAYRDKCRQRWCDEPLRDALANFRHFEAWRPKLLEALLKYHADPMQKQPDGTFLNGSGHLTDFLWTLQTQFQPDPSRLDPLLDFCNHYQKVFLRRGLIIYCTALLRIIEAVKEGTAPAVTKSANAEVCPP